MREEQIEILGENFTFALLPLRERTKLKFKLAALGLKDLSMEAESLAIIGQVIDKMGPDESTTFLAKLARLSIAAPSNLSMDRKETEFFDALEEMEEKTGKDGNAILWTLAIESLLFQFGGIVEALGKKSGINVQKIRDSLRERLA